MLNKYKEYGKFDEIKNKTITTKAIIKKMEIYIGYTNTYKFINQMDELYKNWEIKEMIIFNSLNNWIQVDICFYSDETLKGNPIYSWDNFYFRKNTFTDENFTHGSDELYISHSKCEYKKHTTFINNCGYDK